MMWYAMLCTHINRMCVFCDYEPRGQLQICCFLINEKKNSFLMCVILMNALGMDIIDDIDNATRELHS